MKKFLLFITMMAFYALNSSAQFKTLTIDGGFNADVIANGVGSSSSTTTNNFDGLPSGILGGGNLALVANGTQFSSGGAIVTTGLPANGLIPSGTTSGLDFQLADYSGDNDLRLADGDNGVHTLSVVERFRPATVYILAASGGSILGGSMDVTVNFTDGTSVNSSFSVPDWGLPGGATYTGFQYVDRDNDDLGAFSFFGAPLGPNLYQFAIDIPENSGANASNPTKIVESVSFQRGSSSSPFAVLNILALSAGGSEEALPVEMSPLKAQLNNDSQVQLNWNTYTESANKGFYVERSEDGTQFSIIDFVASEGNNGNSSSEIAYQFTDEDAVSGRVFYRIVQVDLDGRQKLSNVASVSAGAAPADVTLSVFPNPVVNNATVQVDGLTDGGQLVISDATGKVLKRVAVDRSPSNKLSINLSGYASGIYLVTLVQQGKQVKSVKIVKK